ncbi:MAG: phage protein [Rhodocyclales bacterium]|nr:phage protein [Rhodocyclales bacterium]
MSLALYEIGAQYRAMVASLADLDLPPEAIADTIEGEVAPFEDKSRAVACFIANIEAEAEAYAEHGKKSAARATALNNRASSLRDYLQTQMELCDISEIKGPGLLLKLQSNPPSVDVFDAAQIPAEYMRTPPPPAAQPDKTMIKDAIKAGIEIPGAKLNQTRRLVIK